MKSFGQQAERRRIRGVVKEEMLKYVEHFDLCVLWTLHRRGYGAKRLTDFYRDFVEEVMAMRNRYYDKDDMRVFGERGDTYVMRERLKEIGFDYEELTKQMNEEADADGR